MLRCEWKLTICSLVYESFTEHVLYASPCAALEDTKANQTQSGAHSLQAGQAGS